MAKKLRKASMSESSVLGPHERVVLPSSETWLGLGFGFGLGLGLG